MGTQILLWSHLPGFPPSLKHKADVNGLRQEDAASEDLLVMPLLVSPPGSLSSHQEKGTKVVQEVARGQPGDLMLPGFGSQQGRKSPLAPGDSSTPEGHGDTDATGSPLLPLCSHGSADTLEQGQPHPPEEGWGTFWQPLKEQALAAPSHKHRWE